MNYKFCVGAIDCVRVQKTLSRMGHHLAPTSVTGPCIEGVWLIKVVPSNGRDAASIRGVGTFLFISDLEAFHGDAAILCDVNKLVQFPHDFVPVAQKSPNTAVDKLRAAHDILDRLPLDEFSVADRTAVHNIMDSISAVKSKIIDTEGFCSKIEAISHCIKSGKYTMAEGMHELSKLL